jgi:hypothetical protein
MLEWRFIQSDVEKRAEKFKGPLSHFGVPCQQDTRPSLRFAASIRVSFLSLPPRTMPFIFQGGVSFELHNKTIPHRFEVIITDEDKTVLWIEDLQSKKQ